MKALQRGRYSFGIPGSLTILQDWRSVFARDSRRQRPIAAAGGESEWRPTGRSHIAGARPAPGGRRMEEV